MTVVVVVCSHSSVGTSRLDVSTQAWTSHASELRHVNSL